MNSTANILRAAHKMARTAMAQAEGLDYSACLSVALRLAWADAKRPSEYSAGIMSGRAFGRGLVVRGYRSRRAPLTITRLGGGEMSPSWSDRHSVTYELGEGTYRISGEQGTTWVVVPAKGAAAVIDEPASLWADKNAEAAASNAKGGLPALVGSPKQIAWAESIRARILPRLGDEMRFMPETYYAWRSETSASTWIDMRNAPLRAFGE